MRRLALLALLVPTAAAAYPPRAPQRDMKPVCDGPTRPEGEDIVACGTYFLGLQNRNDEHLYNAGVMFSDGKAFGAAIQAFTQLRKEYPNSKLAPRALARLAVIYRDTAMYDRAAEMLEQYARIYAGEKDAYDAMNDAIYFRHALGDDDKAIENTKYFVKTFGRVKPAEAAAAHFALTVVYERRRDHDAVAKHLQEYVRVYGNKGGTDRVVIAHAKIGQIAWDASCPVKPIDGACVKPWRKAGLCSRDTTYEEVPRDDKRVKQAMTSVAAAIKQFEKAGTDDAAARYFYARSLLISADAASEALASSDMKTRESVVAKYQDVIAVKDAATTIHAEARIALLYDRMATDVEQSPAVKSSCDRARAAAAKLRKSSVMAYTTCLDQAKKLGWFDDAGAGVCERGLVRLDPERYPALHERTGRATNVATVTATEEP